jgi:glucokinase
MYLYGGVDVGATHVRSLVGTATGEIRGRNYRKTPQTTGQAVTDAVRGSLSTACETVGIAPSDLSAVGIGSVGPLDRPAGIVREPPNLPDAISEIQLTAPVESLVDAPVSLHNDATAGVIGERFASEESLDNVAYLTLSSGIGAGVCVDGTVLYGHDGNAAEIGHVPLDSSGAMDCGCGGCGHWEAYCSGENIPAYAEYLHTDQETSLPVGDEAFTAADVFEAAAQRDAFAGHVLHRVADWNARGVATLVYAYAPTTLFVGGGVTLGNPDVVLDSLRERVPSLVPTHVPDIRLTTRGDDVVAYGALASAIQEHQESKTDTE